jgi:hypothetical protein
MDRILCGRTDQHDPHYWGGANADDHWCAGFRITGEAGATEPWDRPEHYGGEENPFEPIKIIEHYDLNFNLGNAIKYVLRAPLKGTPLDDLKKAYTYIGFEIRRRERQRLGG